VELKDLFLTPIYLVIIYGLANWLKPKVTNKFTKKYFIPALTVKFIGAISLGVIYQFYYGGGDTFNYFDEAKVVTQAFYDSPTIGIKLLFADGEYNADLYKYATQIHWYKSPTEFFVIKVAGFLGIFSFKTYTVIALWFAFISFTGMWAMYMAYCNIYPMVYKKFAVAIFFLPSVFFWGSGLMKDSLTIGFLGWLFYGFYFCFIEKKSILKNLIITLLAAYVIYSIKVYILLSFLPPALFWVFTENNNRIKNTLLRNLAKPIFIGIGVIVAYFAGTNLTAGDDKYDISKIGERTKINSEFLTEQVYSGSAYNIGTFDGSISSMLSVGPQAIVVALYRPFLWEIRNPIMLLSAIEATIFIYYTLLFFFKVGFFKTLKFISSKPILTFSMIFSLVLAFGVGTNSGNFGTLVRYKIPLMPFYLSALFIMQAHVKSAKKLPRLAVTA
jgi:hypothetical protein